MRARLAVVAVWSACGDGLPPPAVDATSDDPRGLVTISFVADPGERIDGRPVFFQDRDSALVLATRTDGAGRANAYMEPGGLVTLVETRGNSSFLYTYAGVAPGDSLTVDRRTSPGDVVDVEVSIPEAPGAISYLLYDSCAFGGSTDLSDATIPVWVTLVGCRGSASLLVVALFAGGERSYLYRGDVALQPLGRIVFDGAYRPIDAAVVEVSGAPTTAERVFVSQVLADIHLPTTFANVELVTGAGSAVLQLPRPAEAVLATRLDLDGGPSIGMQRATIWGPPSAMTTIDLAGGLRPYTARPWFDKPTRSIRWDEAAAGLPSDVVVAGVAWARLSTSINYQWMLVGPRGADPVIEFPLLPEPELNPTADDAPNPFTLVNLAVEGGYDRVRSQFFGAWSAGAPWPASGPSGRVIYQELGFGP